MRRCKSPIVNLSLSRWTDVNIPAAVVTKDPDMHAAVHAEWIATL